MTDPTPATRFAAILEGLCHAVAEADACPNRLTRALARPLIFFLWGRLKRTIIRFAKILETQPAPKPRRPRRHKPRPAKPVALPRGFNWLGITIPAARAAGSQLRYFLNEPDIAPIVAADPRFARLLRPLCHSLGVRLPESLRPPARPKAPPRIRIRIRMNRPPSKASIRKAQLEYRRFFKTIPAEWLPGKIPPPIPPPRAARTPQPAQERAPHKARAA